jgi:hypothetical protein
VVIYHKEENTGKAIENEVRKNVGITTSRISNLLSHTGTYLVTFLEESKARPILCKPPQPKKNNIHTVKFRWPTSDPITLFSIPWRFPQVLEDT